jgi:hypothetical protein
MGGEKVALRNVLRAAAMAWVRWERVGRGRRAKGRWRGSKGEIVTEKFRRERGGSEQDRLRIKKKNGEQRRGREGDG